MVQNVAGGYNLDLAAAVGQKRRPVGGLHWKVATMVFAVGEPLLSVGVILFKWETNTDTLPFVCDKAKATGAIHRAVFAKR